jgi:hypothetical protein
MTKDEALKLALDALEYLATQIKPDYEHSKAITAIKATLEANEFNPDWDTQSVLTEEIQRMAKRIEELEAKGEIVACGACNGSGRMVRDPDIGTDQECFVCEGTLEAKGEPMEFFDWYDNAHWGNEDFKEGCHRAWNAAIKYTAKTNLEAKDEPWEKFCDSNCVWTDHHPDCKLAEQNPVAWYDSVSGWTDFHSFKPTRKPSSPSAEWLPLYTTPPPVAEPHKRTWVGLTDDEYKELHLQMGAVYFYQDYGRAIEAKLKEKNT